MIDSFFVLLGCPRREDAYTVSPAASNQSTQYGTIGFRCTKPNGFHEIAGIPSILYGYPCGFDVFFRRKTMLKATVSRGFCNGVNKPLRTKNRTTDNRSAPLRDMKKKNAPLRVRLLPSDKPLRTAP